MLRTLHDPERGAQFIEYAAVLVLVASIASLLLSSSLLTRISDLVGGAVSSITQAGTADEGQHDAPEEDGSSSSGSQASSGDGGSSSPASGTPQDDGNTPDLEDSGPFEVATTPDGNPYTLEDAARDGQVSQEEFLNTPQGVVFAHMAATPKAPDVERKPRRPPPIPDIKDMPGLWWENTKSGMGALKNRAGEDLEAGWQLATDPAGTMRESGKSIADDVQKNIIDATRGDVAKVLHGDLGEKIDGHFSASAKINKHLFWDAPYSPGGMLIDHKAREKFKNGDPVAAAQRTSYNYASLFLSGGSKGFLKIAGKGGKTPEGSGNTPDTSDPEGYQRAEGDTNNDTDTGKEDQREDNNDSDESGASCSSNSFLPATPVVLADGSRVDISEVEAGDAVWAFDPRTGEEGPRRVTDTISSAGDKQLVDVAVQDGDGGSQTLTATQEHPFWAPRAGEWVEAGELRVGTWLRTSSGTWVQVQALNHRTASDQPVHNLTVEGLHTYYVGAGNQDVLVHNENNCYSANKNGTKNVREKKNIGKGKNTAIVDYDIDGMGEGQKIGVSGKKNSPDGTSPVPNDSEREFSARSEDGGHSAPWDSEVKALEDLSQDLSSDAKGKLEIYTERPPCSSCRSVISQFEEKYPNVDLHVSWGKKNRTYKDTSKGYIDPDVEEYDNRDWYKDDIPDYLR
ncbi:polymorphic toxin-type HINT domain-containing protein [Haloactinospora alba]|uniref:polymorphic toxin-type HINT domain-containing protein n=1 Tax=Haloactinospora alba TaxID=405555 RepID=UPI001153FA4A|nr:polymorphic toxin-type HINT domain-containing protein [Haloactinospora alba]